MSRVVHIEKAAQVPALEDPLELPGRGRVPLDSTVRRSMDWRTTVQECCATSTRLRTVSTDNSTGRASVHPYQMRTASNTRGPPEEGIDAQ